MFKRVKKKLKEENAIVDYIIQTFGKKYEVEQRLFSYIEEHVNRDIERKEMLTSLDKYDMELCEHPIFDRFKKRLFGADKNRCCLTHIELVVCFLANTKKYYPEVIIDMLWIDKKRFCQIVQLLEKKLIKGKYRLPKGYKAMQSILKEYRMI